MRKTLALLCAVSIVLLAGGCAGKLPELQPPFPPPLPELSESAWFEGPDGAVCLPPEDAAKFAGWVEQLNTYPDELAAWTEEMNKAR